MGIRRNKKRKPNEAEPAAVTDESTVIDPWPETDELADPSTELAPEPAAVADEQIVIDPWPETYEPAESSTGLAPEPAAMAETYREFTSEPTSTVEPDSESAPEPGGALAPEPPDESRSSHATKIAQEPAPVYVPEQLKPTQLSPPAGLGPHLGDAGVVTESIEGEMRVLGIGTAPGVGLRLLDAPIGPPFNDLTLTGLGPGKEGPGPSLSVSGHLIESHRGAAVVHGTLRGPGHADFGEPCQDASGSRALSDDVVAIMAADGVGAGRHSGEVAHHAVKFGLAQLPGLTAGSLSEFDMRGWTDALNVELALKVQAIEAQRPGSKGNATTLVLAVVDLVNRSAAVMRVGDASAWLLGPADALQPVLTSSKEHDDGLVSGKSTALPSRVPHVEGVIADMVGLSGILVCTDGIGDELVTGRSRYARWLTRFLAAPVDPVSYAYAIGMRGRGASDDRGGAMCWLPTVRR